MNSNRRVRSDECHGSRITHRASRVTGFPVLCLFLLCACFVALGAQADQAVPPGSTPQETDLGNKAAAEFEKKTKLVKDDGRLQLMADMVKDLAAATERPKISYSVKIAVEKDPNAFTFPGGQIYVTQGLLDFVESDHELAAVLAHEIAHNSHLHALKALQKEEKLNREMGIALIGGLLLGAADKITDVMAIIPYVFTAVMNGLGVEAEADADNAALTYLHKTKYNPVGLLTFIERLAREESRRPAGPPLGIFQTHPPTKERIEAITAELIALNVPIDRSAVTKPIGAKAVGVKIGDIAAAQVVVGEQVLCQFADADAPALKRAQEAAEKMNLLLQVETHMYQLTLSPSGTQIQIKNTVLMQATEADAKLLKSTPAQLAKVWLANLKQALWKERIKRAY